MNSNWENMVQAALADAGSRMTLGALRAWCHEYMSRSQRIEFAKDPMFFFFYYLGFRLPKHQRRWILLFHRMQLLKLAPRDHGKSWIWVFGLVLWRIYLDYILSDFQEVRFRCLVISKTDGQAQKALGQIKETIDTNPYLIEDFGPIQGRKWLDSYVVCKRHVSSIQVQEKDPTVEAVGVLGAITGGHFDLILLDDILDDENTKTEDRLNGIRNWLYGTIWNLREPNTQTIVVGTRKAAQDVYQDLIDNPVWEHDIERAIIKYPSSWKYTHDKRGIIRGVRIFTNDYEVLWPEEYLLDECGKKIYHPVTKKPRVLGWGIRRLLLDRAVSARTFDREKQNEITAFEGGPLKLEWLRYFLGSKMQADVGGVVVVEDN